MESDLAKQAQTLPATWERAAPWYLTILSALILIGIGWFLVSQILWARDAMFSGDVADNLEYRSHQYFMLISTVRRSVGLFAGIALMLLGVGVVFYTVRAQSKMDFGGHGFSVGIVTASPGIIAMALGTYLIAHNTSSRTVIPIYGGATVDPAAMEAIFDDVDALLDGAAPPEEGEEQ